MQDNVNAADRMWMVRELLGRLSAQELGEVRDEVDSKWEEKLEETKQQVIEEMRRKLSELGVEPSKINVSFGQKRRARKDQGSSLRAKYRGPEGQTWSGRGFVPNWLKSLEEQGRNRDEFLVKDEGEA